MQLGLQSVLVRLGRSAVLARVRRLEQDKLYPEPADVVMNESSSVHSEQIERFKDSIDEVLRVNPDSPLAALRCKLEVPGLADSVCAPGALALVQLAVHKPDSKKVISAAIDACDMSLAASGLLPGATAVVIMSLCAAHCTAVDYLLPCLGQLIITNQDRATVAQVLERSRAAALAKGLEHVEEAVAYLVEHGTTVDACEALTLLLSMAAAAADAVVPYGVSAEEYFAALVQPRGAMELLPNMVTLVADGMVRPLKEMSRSGAIRQSGDMSVQLAARVQNLKSISNQFYELCMLMDPDSNPTWSDIGGAGCMAGFLKPCARNFYELRVWLAMGGECAAAQLLTETTTTDVNVDHTDTVVSRTEMYLQEMVPTVLGCASKVESLEQAQAAAAAAGPSLEYSIRALLEMNNGASPFRPNSRADSFSKR